MPARWRHTARVPASASVEVRARITPTLLRPDRRSGSYHLYDVDRTAYLRARVSPNHAGDCVVYSAEFKTSGNRHHPVTTTRCVTLDGRSTARAFIAGDPAYLGVPIRIRAEWAGDRQNLAADGEWSYLRFVR